MYLDLGSGKLAEGEQNLEFWERMYLDLGSGKLAEGEGILGEDVRPGGLGGGAEDLQRGATTGLLYKYNRFSS